MRKIIEKIISGGQINQQEISEYITGLADTFDRPIKTPLEIQGIIMAIQMGQFDLMYSVGMVCSKLGIPLRTLADKNGVIFKRWIEEEPLKPIETQNDNT